MSLSSQMKMAIPLMVEVLTKAHCAILGKTGSGKTYRAKGYVESLIRAGRRVNIIDPTGAWGGIKASADGKAAGLPAVVFGGDEDGYADLPLTEHSGAAIAKLVGSGQLVVSVLDLSALSISAQHRFMERYLEELYRVNKGALHLVIDEADEFAPQNAQPGTERVLGATARIVQRGRIKGFRAMLISQRPAVLNKRVLTQCNSLVAMRLPAPQDRKAIEEWVKGQADESKAKDLLGSLAGLQRGEGWVWAPEDGILAREFSDPITTFDSGRTPDGTERVGMPAKFADLDLSEIKTALAQSIKEAEENDPKKLRARIAELERGKGAAAVSEQERKAIYEQAWDASYKSHYQGMCDTFLVRMGEIKNAMLTLQSEVRKAELYFGEIPPKDARPLAERLPTELVRDVAPPAKAVAEPDPRPAADLLMNKNSVVRILWGLSLLEQRKITHPTREMLAGVIGTHPRTKGFWNTLGFMRTKGLIDYPEPMVLKACQTVPVQETRPLWEIVAGHLTGRQATIVRFLAELPTASDTRESLAADFKVHPRSKGFLNDIGALSGRGIVVHERGVVSLPEWLH